MARYMDERVDELELLADHPVRRASMVTRIRFVAAVLVEVEEDARDAAAFAKEDRILRRLAHIAVRAASFSRTLSDMATEFERFDEATR